MMNWLYYLLEANLYLAVFYGFYRLFLHRETFYTLNRFYLIAAALIAFSIPFLQMGYLNNLFGRQQDVYMVANPSKVVQKDVSFTVSDLILYCYFITAAAFTLKLGYGIYKIMVLSLSAKKEKAGSIIYIELPDSDTAFSFFNLLFLNPAVTAKNTILKHEMVHIQQKHSLDLIFFEIIQIISWFNPAAYFIKKDIKLVHEYIADDLTTNADIHKHEYAMFLIQNSFGIMHNQLTNQIFNQSILKRRINMLNKERSTGRARLKLLFALPIAGGMLCASTMAFTKDYAMVDLYPEKYESAKAAYQEPVKKNTAATKVKSDKKVVKFPPPIVKPDAPEKASSTKVVKFPPPIVKPNAPEAPKKPASVKKIKFPPPIVTKDVPPPPPPAPPKPEKAVKYEGKNKEEALFETIEDVKQVKVVNADMEGIKQVKINANKDKKATETFSYSIVVKPEKELEKVKSDLKEVKINYVEKEKNTLKPVKKEQ